MESDYGQRAAMMRATNNLTLEKPQEPQGVTNPLQLLHITPATASKQRDNLRAAVRECEEAIAKVRSPLSDALKLPAQQVTAATMCSASALLCRPYAQFTAQVVSDVSVAVRGESRGVPAVQALATPLDDEVLANNLLLDLAMRSQLKSGNLLLADADWLLAKYLDNALSGLQKDKNSYFTATYPTRSPTGFYDSLVDGAMEANGEVLTALHRYLLDASAACNEAASASIRGLVNDVFSECGVTGSVSPGGSQHASVPAAAAQCSRAAAMLATSFTACTETINQCSAFVRSQGSFPDNGSKHSAADHYTFFVNQFVSYCRELEKAPAKQVGPEQANSPNLMTPIRRELSALPRQPPSATSLSAAIQSQALPKVLSIVPPSRALRQRESATDNTAHARVFVTLQLLRRLATYGLSAFVNNNSSTTPHRECYQTVREHVPDLQTELADKIKGHHTAVRPFGTRPHRSRKYANEGQSKNRDIEDPTSALLQSAVAEAPDLAFLAPIVHHFASSVPQMALPDELAGPLGLGGELEHPFNSLASSGLRQPKQPAYSEATLAAPLKLPTSQPVADLLQALHERLGDGSSMPGGDRSMSEVRQHQVERLALRNMVLERENDELRKCLQLQSQAIQQLSSSPSTPNNNPLKEMASIQSQLLKTLSEVTAALKVAGRSASL